MFDNNTNDPLSMDCAVPLFDYTSAFTYKRGPNVDDVYKPLNDKPGSTNDKPTSLPQKIAYNTLVALSGFFLLFTFPVTAFFSFKKINSLQRCLIYRLGARLPTKGPGIVLTLPFIDQACLVDLADVEVDVTKADQQLLTSDGSIISMTGTCRVIVSVTNAWQTTLKTSTLDHREWLSIRFANVLRSTDIDVLENKMDYVCKSFQESSNEILARWGYSIRFEEMPKFTVLKRAERMAHVQRKIKQLLKIDDDSSQSMSQEELMAKLLAEEQADSKAPSAMAKVEQTKIAYDQFDSALERAKQMLVSLIAGSSFINWMSLEMNIELVVKDTQEGDYIEYFQYCQQTIVPCTSIPSRVDCALHFKSRHDFYLFTEGQSEKPDMSLVDITIGEHLPMKAVIEGMIKQSN